jgi:hypothetical protein
VYAQYCSNGKIYLLAWPKRKVPDTFLFPRAAFGRNQTGLVGAPLVGALVVGTHEGCPYETRKMFANKTRIYGIAIQRCAAATQAKHSPQRPQKEKERTKKKGEGKRKLSGTFFLP